MKIYVFKGRKYQFSKQLLNLKGKIYLQVFKCADTKRFTEEMLTWFSARKSYNDKNMCKQPYSGSSFHNPVFSQKTEIFLHKWPMFERDKLQVLTFIKYLLVYFGNYSKRSI